MKTMPVAIDPRKQREARFLSSFLALSNIPARMIEPREAPDFLLELDGRQIGLELTEVFVPALPGAFTAQARESTISRVVDEAMLLYETRGGRPLFVGIGIPSNADLRGIKRSQTADALATLVLSLAPSPGETVEWKPPAAGNPLLSHIAFLIVRAQEVSCWWAPQGALIAPLTEPTLQARIDEKAKKLNDYRAVAAEVWLLLAIEGLAPSQLFDLNATIRSDALRSPFNRTFLISVVNSQCTELCIAA